MEDFNSKLDKDVKAGIPYQHPEEINIHATKRHVVETSERADINCIALIAGDAGEQVHAGGGCLYAQEEGLYT